MPWSAAVTTQFSLVDLYTHDETEFYGPYNSLLFELFPTAEDYQISPQFKNVEGSLDFTIQYIVHHRHMGPIFFLEIKAYRTLKDLSARVAADDQTRQSFGTFASSQIPIPTLYGASAFGPVLCIYEFTTATRRITPPRILPERDIINDTAPEDQWEFDIMKEEGEARLRAVVTHIKAMAATI